MSKKFKKIMLMTLAGMASVASVPSVYAGYTDSMQTYVIHTYGGADLIPVVRQQLHGTNSTVSSYQDKLVVMTTPAGYKKVQNLLKQIDSMPQSLNISVRVGNQTTSTGTINQSRIILGGQIGRSSNINVGAEGKFGRYHQKSQQNNAYQVQTLSGKSATIATGQLLSMAHNYVATRHNGYGQANKVVFIQGQRLVPTVQGISVTPRVLSNNQVQLAVNQQNDKLTGNRFKLVNSQSLSNNIIVSRGTWVTIGSVNQSRSSMGSGWQGQVSDVVYPIQIKVD